MDDTATPVRKTTRARKTVVKSAEDKVESDIYSSRHTALPIVQSTPSDNLVKLFDEIVEKISQSKLEYERLQKEIVQTKQSWTKEQQDHQRNLEEKSKLEELKRKQEEELYQYEISRKHKVAEDEFKDKKADWDRYLQEQKDVIEKERKELVQLRALAENFEKEQQKAVDDAKEILRQSLTSEFGTERKIKEQEIKAEKDILNLKIGNLSEENKRLSLEVDNLKKAIDQATSQVKEIALKVIESRSNSAKPQVVSEN